MEFTGNELILAHNIKGGLIKLANLMDFIIENAGGTGGAVSSVNGKTGAVVITANDVNAPTKTQFENLESDVRNTADYVEGLPARVTALEQGSGGGTPRVEDILFTTEQNPNFPEGRFTARVTVLPEGYEPTSVRFVAVGSDKAVAYPNGVIQVSNIEVNGFVTFEVLAIVDGFVKVRYYMYQKNSEGVVTLYEDDNPFAGA